MKTAQGLEVNNRTFFQIHKEEEVNKGIIRISQRQKSRDQMPEEVGITEKLNELFASLFMREEDELLPKREMHFPEREK